MRIPLVAGKTWKYNHITTTSHKLHNWIDGQIIFKRSEIYRIMSDFDYEFYHLFCSMLASHNFWVELAAT